MKQQTLTGKDIEKIVESEVKFDWQKQMEWLDYPPFPFKRPIILQNGAMIWLPCQIHPNTEIGKNVVIGAFTNICGPVKIGDYTRMQGFNFIPAGITIEQKVFIGPGVIFTNVKHPTARFGKLTRDRVFENTLIKEKASIGASATICPGVTIGRGAMIAAGSIVTSDVMDGWLVKGNPARHIKLYLDLEEEERQMEKWNLES